MAELRLPFNSDDNIDYGNPLADKLFFANVPHVSITKDLVSKTEASVVSSLSKMVGEFYVQDELVTLDPTRWDIAYPYAALGGLDNSSYSMMWRIKMHTVPQSGTAAFIFRWGNNEFHLRRNGQKIELLFGGGGYVYTSGNLADGQIITLALTRNSSDYVVKTYLDGVEVKSYASFSYTTFNNASYIEYHGEADQRGEGFAAVYVWVDRTLTPSEIVDLTENPYQLLEPSQLNTTEYCISLTGANDKVIVPLSGAYTGTTELSDGTQTPISGTGTYTIDGTVAQRIKKITVTDTNGLHVYYFDLTEPQYSVNKVVNGTFDTDTNWLKTGGCTISGSVGHVDGTGSASLLYQSMLVQGRKYKVEFDVTNHVAGTTVVWNNDGTTLYTITGNGHVSFTFTHAIANGNFIFRANAASYDVDNVVVQEVVVNSLTSNLAANLAGSPVFEVIVPSQVITIGTGQTYTDFPSFITAHRYVPFLPIGEIHGVVPVTVNLNSTATYLYNSAAYEQYGLVLKGTQPVKGNINGKSTLELVGSGVFTWGTTGWLDIQSLVLKTSESNKSFLMQTSSRTAYIKANDFAIIGGGGGTRDFSALSVSGAGKIHAKDGVVYNMSGSGIYPNLSAGNEAQASFENILVIDCNTSGDVYYEGVQGRGSFINILSSNTGSADFASASKTLAVNSMAEDTTLGTLNGNLQSQPIKSWITNIAGGDFTINETGQTALAGKGWNGSDLLKEFWAEATANINITQVLTGSGSLQLQVEAQRLLSSILNGTGDLISIVETLKSIGVNTSTIADIVSVLESSKSINSSTSGSGNISTAIEIIRMLSSTITSTGDLIVVLEVLRLLDSAVTGGSDLTSIALHALRSLDIIVEGAGSLVSTVTKESLTEALVTLILTGGGSISTNIFSNKLSDSTITTESNIYTLYNKTGNITSGSTATGDILASLSTVKSSDSNVSALGGVLVFLEKDVLTAVSITGSGISSEVFQTDKLSGNLVISGGGSTISVSVKDIASITNVVFVELSATASKYNISMDIYAENSNIGINTNASN